MKYYVDGDALCITRDDFVDLQSSPAVFIEAESKMAQTIIAKGLRGLTFGELASIEGQLKDVTTNDDRLQALVARKLHKLMGCLAEERERWFFHQLLIRCSRCAEVVPVSQARLVVDGPHYGLTVKPGDLGDIHHARATESLEMTLDEYHAVLCAACQAAVGVKE